MAGSTLLSLLAGSPLPAGVLWVRSPHRSCAASGYISLCFCLSFLAASDCGCPCKGFRRAWIIYGLARSPLWLCPSKSAVGRFAWRSGISDAGVFSVLHTRHLVCEVVGVDFQLMPGSTKAMAATGVALADVDPPTSHCFCNQPAFSGQHLRLGLGYSLRGTYRLR